MVGGNLFVTDDSPCHGQALSEANKKDKNDGEERQKGEE